MRELKGSVIPTYRQVDRDLNCEEKKSFLSVSKDFSVVPLKRNSFEMTKRNKLLFRGMK